MVTLAEGAIVVTQMATAVLFAAPVKSAKGIGEKNTQSSCNRGGEL